MTITVTQVTSRSADVLGQFQATPQADPWVAEVETYLLGPAMKNQIKNGGALWVITSQGLPVGLAATCPHQYFAAELLQAFMIDRRHRGHGLARPALEAVLTAVHAVSFSRYTMWLVHPNNHIMVKLSASIDPAGGTPTDDGYLMFAHP